jgi:acetyl esterase/lipase
MSEDILTRKPPPADQRLPYGSDRNQFLDLRFARGDKAKALPPLVVNIHGGFWRAKYDLEYGGHLCSSLAAKGLTTANLEYRRVGNKGGGWPGSFDDVRSALHFLKRQASKHNFDPSRVMVMGHSAGAQLALCLAAYEPGLAGVASLAGVLDLQKAYDLHLSDDAVVEFMGGRPNEVPHHYVDADPMRLPIPPIRQCLIHGLNDDIVPPAFSRQYVAKHNQAESITLIEVPSADHFDLIDPESNAWEIVVNAVLQFST